MTKGARFWQLSAISVVSAVVFGFGGPAGKNLSAAENKDRFVAARYITFDAFPLDFFYTKIGTAKSITICLPEQINLAAVPLAILDLSAEDIDEKKETQIFINDHGPIPPPTGILDPGGQVIQAYLTIPVSFLKPGANELKFVFADNLNLTTSGFTINDASLLLLPDITRDGDKAPIPYQATEISLGQLGAVLVVEPPR